MAPIRTAQRDERLIARVTRSRPLTYPASRDHDDRDLPPHVRGASGLAWWGSRLVCVQDDVLWLTFIDPDTAACGALALPSEPGEARLFDDGLGNKRLKPDLEACFVTREGSELWLVAFGSGSTPARERLLFVRASDEPQPRVHGLAWIPAHALYARLRETIVFEGAKLNLEGAAQLPGERVRLFQRASGGRLADATCELSWPVLAAALARGEQPPVAALDPGSIVRWDLGTLGAVRLTFTDAAPAQSGGIAFLAAAEDSADAVEDGGVTGSALGVIDAHGRARWGPLLDCDGAQVRAKVEGLALDPRDPSRAYAVTDHDAPERHADLLEIELRGPWS